MKYIRILIIAAIIALLCLTTLPCEEQDRNYIVGNSALGIFLCK